MLRGVWLALLLSVGPLSAQEPHTYLIRLKPPGKGSETTLDLDSRFRMLTEKWDLGGKSLGEDLNVLCLNMSLNSTILEMSGNEPTRWRRQFTKVISTYNGDQKQDPAQGQIALFIKMPDGKYQIVTENGEPISEELKAKLQAQLAQTDVCATQQETLAPKKAVQVGETWPIDAASWAQHPGAELTLTSATGRLTKVYLKGTQLHGVIEARAEFRIKSLVVNGRKFMMDPGARIIMTSTTEGCIDGSSWGNVEKCEFLLTAALRNKTPDGLDARLDQEILIRTTRRTH
jgi:hypothetical protein